MNTDILEGRGMGGVLYPELQGDNTVMNGETLGKTRSKYRGYCHVLGPWETLLGTNY